MTEQDNNLADSRNELADSRNKMQELCYQAGLTPGAAAQLIKLTNEFYDKVPADEVLPAKEDYLTVMLAGKRVPKGIPSEADIEAARMAHPKPKPKPELPMPEGFPFPPKKFSQRIKATIK